MASNSSPFYGLPNEVRLLALSKTYPCRESQLQQLGHLLNPLRPSPKNIIIHGLEATGKTCITKEVLDSLSPESFEETEWSDDEIPDARYAFVKSAECITGRHLLESTVGAVAEALELEDQAGKCESLAQLAVELQTLLELWQEGGGPKRFVLVFDGIDRQNDAPQTLLPALGRLAEVIPNLTTIFIVTSPRPRMLHQTGIVHIYFPSYTKNEALEILSLEANLPDPIHPLSDPQTNGIVEDDTLALKAAQETKHLWTRFCSAIWDTLTKHSGRDILSFHSTSLSLWPSFTAPILDGLYTRKEFSRLLVAKRSIFQSEQVLIPSIIPSGSSQTVPAQPQTALSRLTKSLETSKGIGTQLPYFSRVLLVAAYLASYNKQSTDIQHFSKTSSRRKRKRGGSTALPRGRPGTVKHRKISRKLLGPQAFVLERMLAIFHALRSEAKESRGRSMIGEQSARTADVQGAIATLASLRLLVKTSGVADPLDATTKWKVNVGWDVARGVGRSVGIEVEEFMAE